jgi:DNA polymerase III sliding clamp (beta) subunit (PCNA family)
MILKIHGTVPKSAYSIAVTMMDGAGFAVCVNAKGKEVARFAARAIDGKYPEYEQVLPEKDAQGERTNEICANAKYLARVAKVFPEGMRMTFHGPMKPIVFEDTPQRGDSPTIIIMPVRSE